MAALESAPPPAVPGLGALEERLTALETAPAGDLAESFTVLEGRVAALEQAPTSSAGGEEVTALQEQVSALTQQLNDLQSQLEASGTPPEDAAEGMDTEDTAATPEEPDVDLGEALAAPAAVALSGERGKFYLGVGGFYEIGYTNTTNSGEGTFGFLSDVRIRPRVTLGVDDIASGFGLRASADYGRQSLIDAGSLATSGHLTYTLGSSVASGYLGVGGGYQFSDLIFASGVDESIFAGALLGAEFGNGPLTFFVEGNVDYYFSDTGVVGYEQLYPTVAVGLNLRP